MGGIYLVRRFAPPLADTPVAQVASLITEILSGAAAATAGLNVFLAIRAATADEYSGFSRADAVADQLANGLWQGGVLLAAGAAVHLLAPPSDLPRHGSRS